jgi:hypothetical protein
VFCTELHAPEASASSTTLSGHRRLLLISAHPQKKVSLRRSCGGLASGGLAGRVYGPSNALKFRGPACGAHPRALRFHVPCLPCGTGVPTFSGSRGLGRGTRKRHKARRSSAGALLNISPPQCMLRRALALAGPRVGARITRVRFSTKSNYLSHFLSHLTLPLTYTHHLLNPPPTHSLTHSLTQPRRATCHPQAQLVGHWASCSSMVGAQPREASPIGN